MNNYFLEESMPHAVQEAQHLSSEDDEGGAIRLLRDYLIDNPMDVEALLELANLTWIDDPEFALAQALKARSVSGIDCRIMAMEARCLNYLGRNHEAKDKMELLWAQYATVPEHIRLTRSALVYAREFARVHWQVLTDLGENEEALKMALIQIDGPGIGDPYEDPYRANVDLPGIGPEYVRESLLQLGRYRDVEMMKGENPFHRRDNIWSIGTHFFNEGEYRRALPFFRRYMTLSSWEKDAPWYHGYIECLILAGEADEAALVCGVFLLPKETRSAIRRTYIEALQGCALHSLGRLDAAASIVTGLKETVSWVKVQRAIRKYRFKPDIQSHLDEFLAEYWPERASE